MIFEIGDLVKKPNSDSPDLVGVVVDIKIRNKTQKIGIQWPNTDTVSYEHTYALQSLDR